MDTIGGDNSLLKPLMKREWLLSVKLFMNDEMPLTIDSIEFIIHFFSLNYYGFPIIC